LKLFRGTLVALRRAAAILLLIFAIVAAGALIPRPFFPPDAGKDDGEKTRIFVVSNPIHSDLVVPLTDEIRARFAFLEATGMPMSHPAANWLVLGWGGRSFYLETPTWGDLKPLPVFKALTLDAAVLHANLAAGVDEKAPGVSGHDLSPPQLDALVTFILASFTRRNGEVVVIKGAGYGDYDRFFEAEGSFNALFGCNTWTATALRRAGLRTGLWNPLPKTLNLSLKIYN
jgi:uncharacterized protein (TIGR02117 family)